jgi:alginate O-acetyltransferase complex protein AlgJ
VAGSAGIPDSRQSPVLLLGDSHNLVFHTGAEMHATGAGLPDQLFLELGFPMDVVAVMGSGSTAARRSLARRKDNLAGKKVVVWCFSTREFTQGQGWSKVPVVKDAAANSVLK